MGKVSKAVGKTLATVLQSMINNGDGINIVEMLSDDGKVYVFHRKDDRLLQYSARYLNGSIHKATNRLGQFGADLSKVHSDTIKSKIKNVNVIGFPVKPGTEVYKHGYMLSNYMIWFYEK